MVRLCLLVCLMFVTGCGQCQRVYTGVTGGFTYKCSDSGVEYVQSDSGIAVHVGKDGLPVVCGK